MTFVLLVDVHRCDPLQPATVVDKHGSDLLNVSSAGGSLYISMGWCRPSLLQFDKGNLRPSKDGIAESDKFDVASEQKEQ